MTCDEVKQRIVEVWAGSQPPGVVQEHLEICEGCRQEALMLGSLWDRLSDLPAPEPSTAMRVRWESTLASLASQLGDAESRRERDRAIVGAERSSKWFAWWPKHPAWQMGIAAACLAVGIFSGQLWRGRDLDKTELSELRKEVTGTREMVALSLLRENTASERLKGVDYSGRMSRLEPDVVTALLRAVSDDPNVNVRLAAIDALSRASGDSGVRQSLLKSMPAQESPMVQAALIDYMTDAHERNASEVLREWAAKPELNPVVKQRATRALQILSQ